MKRAYSEKNILTAFDKLGHFALMTFGLDGHRISTYSGLSPLKAVFEYTRRIRNLGSKNPKETVLLVPHSIQRELATRGTESLDDYADALRGYEMGTEKDILGK